MKLIAVLFGVFCLYITRTEGQIIVEADEIFYNLYNTNNRATPVSISATSLPDNAIDTDSTVVFLVHGWLDGPSITSGNFGPFVAATKEAYFNKGITNVVVVDWSYYANQFATSYTYLVPALQSGAVGEFVGQMIVAMATKYGITYDKFHLVGHSLGAHVCGFAGKYVTSDTSEVVGRITALDPAGPGYISLLPISRLAVGDAVLVDAIHTSTLAGYPDPIGNVDFFPNGGVLQPGCTGLDAGICSHVRALALFSESVSTGNFLAWSCSYTTIVVNRLLTWLWFPNTCCAGTSGNKMGEDVNASNPGAFYLITNSASLYAKSNVCS